MPEDINTKITVTEEKQHSILSPSSSKIWLACTPSALMSTLMPEEDTFFTHEGTTAHELAEYKVRKYVIGDDSVADPRLDAAFADEVDEEMESYTDSYADYAARTVESFEDEGYVADVFTEITLDLSSFVPEGKGTADLVIIAGDTIKIIDFKYGAFRKVDGERNSQMMIYALGAAEEFKDYGPFNKVSMTIFQPRMDNVVSDEIEMDELVQWRDSVVIPQAEKAIKGDGELVMGDHCEFCRAKLLCKKYREKTIKNMEAINTLMEEIKESLSPAEQKSRSLSKIMANLLSPEQMGYVMSLGEGVANWVDNVRGAALKSALEGEKIPGYKLVEAEGKDIVTDAAAEKVAELGKDPYKPREYKSKSALSDELGAKIFTLDVLPLMGKAPSKPALVKEEKKGVERTAEYFKKKEEAENTGETVYVEGTSSAELPPVTALVF